MTTEYVQVLRDAIAHAIQWEGMKHREDVGEVCYRWCPLCKLEKALAAPIPPAPLRQMSEAPRDGNEWVSLVGAKLESNRYYLAWRPDRHMAFMLTGQQIDLMNESSTAEHLSMDLTHYRQMPDGPESAIQAAKEQG